MANFTAHSLAVNDMKLMLDNLDQWVKNVHVTTPISKANLIFSPRSRLM